MVGEWLCPRIYMRVPTTYVITVTLHALQMTVKWT